MNIKKELVLKLLENDFFRKSSGDQIGMIFDNLNSYYYNKFNLLLGNNKILYLLVLQELLYNL